MENMNNSSTETELTFDINADISRQYTRDGRKVLTIHKFYDEHLVYPISAVIEGEDSPRSYTGNGTFYKGTTIDQLDIVTRTEVKPLIVDYLNVYRNGLVGEHSSASEAVSAAGRDPRHLAVVKLTYNPNDGSVSAEIASE